MKNILKSLFVLSLLVAFWSCNNEDNDPVGSVQTAPALIAPTASGNYILAGATASNEIFLLEWSSANFGFSAATKYTLQITKASGDWSSNVGSIILLTTNSPNPQEALEYSLTQRALNTALLAAGGSIGVSESFKMRIKAEPLSQLSVSQNPLIAYSAEQTFTAKPYDSYDEYSRIYVPGSYQSASGYGSSWSPNDANVAKLYSKNNDGNYEGFVYMNEAAPEFKFCPVPAWSGDKGESNPSGAFSGNLGTASNIKPSFGAGTYFFTVNWNNLTYTMAKRQMAIIGEAVGGWGSPIYLTFDTNSASAYYQKYTANVTLVANKEFLIRTNDDWSTKLGSPNSDNPYVISNVTTGCQLKSGGNNLKVTQSGNYKVVVDVRNAANYNLKFVPN